MDWMIEPIFWNWLILAAILFLIEALNTSFFFMFWGMSALLVAAITFFVPELSWEWQFLIFAIISIPALLLWRSITRKWQSDPNDAASKLNNRGRYLVGRQYVLKTPIEQNYGRLQIDDTMWTIHGENMPAGTKVIVTEIDSSTLYVARVVND